MLTYCFNYIGCNRVDTKAAPETAIGMTITHIATPITVVALLLVGFITHISAIGFNFMPFY